MGIRLRELAQLAATTDFNTAYAVWQKGAGESNARIKGNRAWLKATRMRYLKRILSDQRSWIGLSDGL
jgi:hypothetical protein